LTFVAPICIIIRLVAKAAGKNPVSFGLAEKIVFRGIIHTNRANHDT
jgi:hypothetical protein